MVTSSTGSQHFDTARPFDRSLAVLTEAATLIQSDCFGKGLGERVNEDCARKAEHVAGRIALLQAERPGRVSVLVLGEFKAGKSTLVNALLRRVVAAVDVFEMTTAVCRIVPIEAGTEGAVLRTEDRSAPALKMSLAEFLARSQDRSLGLYTQVDLHVKSNLDLVLVDTPGLGATLANEVVAVDALGTADVVLWTLDADSLGGAREAAILNGIEENRLPLICVLTKADVLAEDEVAETVEYLADTFRLPPTTIFPVSAVEALEKGKEAGVERLRQYLTQSIVPRGAVLREQALLAHASDIAAELIGVLNQILASLDGALQQIGEYQAALEENARTVTEDICSEISSRLREGLIREINARIDARLGASGDTSSLSEADIALVLKDSTQKLSGQQFWSALADEVEHRIQAQWSDGIREQIALLVSSLNEVRHEADRDVARMAEELLQVQMHEAYKKETSVAYGLETVTAAVITTVFTGNLFIGLLSAAPMLYRWFKSNENVQTGPTSYDRRLLFQKGIETWVENTVQSLVGDNFYQQLLAVNLRVAQEACKSYARKREQWPLTFDELSDLIARCEASKTSSINVKARVLALPGPTVEVF